MAKFNSRQGERKGEKVVKIKGEREEEKEERRKGDNRWRDGEQGSGRSKEKAFPACLGPPETPFFSH